MKLNFSPELSCADHPYSSPPLGLGKPSRAASRYAFSDSKLAQKVMLLSFSRLGICDRSSVMLSCSKRCESSTASVFAPRMPADTLPESRVFTPVAVAPKSSDRISRAERRWLLCQCRRSCRREFPFNFSYLIVIIIFVYCRRSPAVAAGSTFESFACEPPAPSGGARERCPLRACARGHVHTSDSSRSASGSAAG
jgi:hypothetical protein